MVKKKTIKTFKNVTKNSIVLVFLFCSIPIAKSHTFFFHLRKCKLTTTGPWQEVPPIALSDITILPCGPKSTVEQVPLWAISNKGDVLCRLGVTSLTPGVRAKFLIF